jgi:hypothetical protein
VVAERAEPVELDRIRRHRLLNRVEQVGAVHRVGVLAVQPRGLGGQVLGGQHCAVPPAAELPADVQLDRPLAERVEHAEPAEHAGRVRRNHDARADLTQFPCLLVDDRRHAGLVQERRGGQPAEPAADDRDPRHQSLPGTRAHRSAEPPAKRRAERRWSAL